MDKTDALEKIIVSTGVSSDAAKIYVYLLEVGESTILEISRSTEIPRTTVYRTIDILEKRGFITKVLAGKIYYQAKSIEQISLLLEIEEEKIKKVKHEIEKFKDIFGGLEYVRQPGTNIRFYKGKVGIRQMVWNVLDAKTEILGYTYRDVTEVVGKDFAEKFKMEVKLRGIRLRDLYTTSYSKSKIMSLIPDTNTTTQFVSQDILHIHHQMDIYNDIVAMYNWHNGEVFGVELENSQIADMQRQIFEIVWQATGEK